MSVETPKKTKAVAKPKAVKAAHPPSSTMVKHAIAELKESKGSSIQAIKKYIAAHYKVDIVKMSPFIRKALKAGVDKGILTQTKGQGASGSFKLKEKKVVQKPTVKKTVAKKPTAKKATKSPKKSVKKTTKAKTPVKKATKTKTPVKKAFKKPVAKKTTKKTTAKKA
eukprot:TRINITY_DN3849_c0_g1_i1.p1 TRINITY_DN3849_c0_g1~~TRINITY_DN3849_c0_g1_i1.p1  ORF type:complete len:167 (-),score=87.13 TRINITY_DN3849_c0_g1_i1:1016-1516(-)